MYSTANATAAYAAQYRLRTLGVSRAFLHLLPAEQRIPVYRDAATLPSVHHGGSLADWCVPSRAYAAVRRLCERGAAGTLLVFARRTRCLLATIALRLLVCSR